MNKYDGIDKRIVSNVKTYARNLQRKLLFRSMNTEDIEQELMCAVFSSINKFDEHCGKFEHFIRKILNRRCATLIETYTRKKRDSIIVFSEYRDEISICDRREFRELFEKQVEVSDFINLLPIKFKMLYQLLSKYSIADTAMITGLSRSSISRDIRRIAYFFNHFISSEDHLFFVSNLRRKLMSRNLSTIETLDVKGLSQLEICDLADLSDQVSKLVSHTKELKEKLDDALNLRFSETVQNKLHDENKDTGTAKFYEGGFQIIAEVPKKVTWDSKLMEEIIKGIPEAHRKDYIKTTYSIDERKYACFPPEYQQLFKPARTITPGKTKFKISIPEEV